MKFLLVLNSTRHCVSHTARRPASIRRPMSSTNASSCRYGLLDRRMALPKLATPRLGLQHVVDADVVAKHGARVAVPPYACIATQAPALLRSANELRIAVVLCVHSSTSSPNMSTTMTVRLEDDVKDRLDVLAAATQRSKSFLAAEAIRSYVENNEWQVGEIQAALKEADAGDFASDRDVTALARKWKVNAA